MSFLANVLASVIGGALLIWFAALISSKARWIFTAAIARWLDIDVEFVFRNSTEAARDLAQELEQATDICIFTSRGGELQRETFAPVFSQRGAKKISVRVLLPDTALPPGTFDWTDQREQEAASFDHAFGAGMLARQIETTVAFMLQQVAAGAAQLRLFNAPHLGRLILTERYAYFTPYRADAHGHNTKVYKFRRGDMYDNFKRLFEQLWSATSRVPTA
jgi:hypothetical protein